MFLAGLVLTSLVRWEQLSQTLGLILFGIWVVGEIALFPVLRVAYESEEDRGGAAALIGARGVAQDALTPEGWVRIGAERWRAVAAQEATPVAAGTTVRVIEVRGLTLVIEPATEAGADGASRAVR
jgi:membrane-bound ClpP family serine protease